MANILITGITGFSGSHLADLLVNTDNNIFGTIRGRCRQTDFIDHIKDKLTLLECDLNDFNSVIQTIEDAQPDIIYHLAAQSFVPTSWRAPQETLNTNVIGTLNMLESVRKTKFDPKILIAGSSEEYGLVLPDEVPIKETNPLRPISPYAVSKVAQDFLGYQYQQSYGMKIIRTRSFNIIGPRSGEKIVTANFAKQIADIEKGKKDPIMYVGNLEASRDFNDVRDVVRAYTLAVEKCDYSDVYNIATGNDFKIQSVLDSLLKMTDKKIDIKQDPKRMRPSDVMILKGDSTKFRNKTGWRPEYTFEQSLKDVLDYWRTAD
ncbi:GDP-mannose 4,6-dehydratase [Candidatus Aenigmatarchaeota archaeon]